MPTLDGWRAIAISIVVLSHDRLHVMGPLSTRWLIQNGVVGVQIFFALSGLLICTRLLKEEQVTGSICLKTFYTRRLFRIQPASWTYLIVVSALMLVGVLEHAFSGVLSSVLLLRNYLPVIAVPRDWYTAHFWSLSVEEHFYLLLPGFLLLVKRRRASVLLAAAATSFCWQAVVRRYPGLEFGTTPEEHTELSMVVLLLGSAAAVMLERRAVKAWCDHWLSPYASISAAVLLFCAQLMGNRFMIVVGIALVYPAMLASTMLHPSSWPGRVLEWQALQFLGRISYSVYLWQMLFFSRTGFRAPVDSRLLAAIQDSTPLRYLALLLASVTSYYLVEKPLIRVGHRLTRASTA